MSEGFVFNDPAESGVPDSGDDFVFGSDEDTQTSGEAFDDFTDDGGAGGVGEADAVKAAPPPPVKNTFPHIAKTLEESGIPTFDDPDYYKKVMGSGDEAQRLHAIYQKYLKAKDPKDKAVFRQQIINPFWEFYAKAANDAPGTLSEQRKFLLRFAMLNPNALPGETKTFFSQIITKPSPEPAVVYMDEWFRKVGRGEIKASTTDEVAVSSRGGNESARARSMLEKANGRMEGAKTMLRTLNDKRLEAEQLLKDKIEIITEHSPNMEFEEVETCYGDEQKRAMSEIQDVLKTMSSVNREMANQIQTLVDVKGELHEVEARLEELGAADASSVDLQAVSSEFMSVRQMAKMTVGRQGNAFPFLTGEYFHCPQNMTGTRENVIKTLTWIENIDCEVFIRKFRNQVTRIVPYILLLPTYGDYGICWEPYDKMNKTSSRGRVAVPMYPKNLTLALLTAIGDFRWQYAKEAASFYWMEEGLTGNFYQWVQSQKLKGDLKMHFIQAYIMWMTKESEGIQKLDKEVRGIFWRYMPFAQPVKERLKDRNLIYQELYQRDKNRAMSDGY